MKSRVLTSIIDNDAVAKWVCVIVDVLEGDE